jgi:hypothetical protein
MFVLVGSKEPLYKMEMRSRKEESAHVDEFLLHSALDVVDELMWTTPAMALKVVDKFNDQLVSAFVTPSSVKFLLLHETRNDDTIRAFFHEVHELYLKVREWVISARSLNMPSDSLAHLLAAPHEPLLRVRHAHRIRGVRRARQDPRAAVSLAPSILVDTSHVISPHDDDVFNATRSKAEAYCKSALVLHLSAVTVALKATLLVQTWQFGAQSVLNHAQPGRRCGPGPAGRGW